MRIAIIGAGISGLRAGLELAADHDITLIEKSAGVGGRVSTRRVEDAIVNHGATKFDRFERLFENDPLAHNYRKNFNLFPAATSLPKAMRDDLLSMGAKLMLNTEISSVSDKKIFLTNRNHLACDAILMTCPLPQARKLLNADLLSQVSYSKEIKLIGIEKNVSMIKDLSPGLVEEIFELSEDDIRLRCDVNPNFMVKKWRYARVVTGIPTLFCKITYRMLVAGDAFDPTGEYDMSSAWISGHSAGMFLN